MSALALALLAGCRREPVEPAPAGEPPLPEGTFAEIAEALGFTAQPGAMIRVDADKDCCDPTALCWFGNPTAPYLAYALPPAPGQTVPDYGVADGLATGYHLRPDEAVVLIGTAPPEVSYWGASSFVGTRVVAGRVTAPRGATGPSVNNAAVDLAPGEPYAVVTTMDAALEREVVRWLEASGVPAGAIHADRVPLELVRPGIDPTADTFAHVLRLDGFADPEAGEAWMANPGARVLRITPQSERPVSEPHPIAQMPARGAGSNEVPWLVASAALGDAIRARYEGQLTLEMQIEPVWLDPYACIEQGYCGFDSSDRYFGLVRLPFTIEEGEVVVAYGVNHQRSGKAAHHSVSLSEVEHLLEIVSLGDRAMVGSARGWLDDPLADDLYAVAFARSCDGLPAPCFEIGGGCPGAEAGELMVLSTRAFLEPGTGTGPLASELVIDRVIKVFDIPFPPTTAADSGDTGAR